MEIFKSKPKEVQVFRSKQEAYSHLFFKLQGEGIDVEKASERAFKFAEEYASAMGLPLVTEHKETGVKGVIQNIKVVATFCKENPEILEFGKGVISTLIGAAAGLGIAKIAQEPEPQRIEPIVYDETEFETNNTLN